MFPGLDKNDPLSSPDEDEIPAKFKSRQIAKELNGPMKFDEMIDEYGEVNM